MDSLQSHPTMHFCYLRFTVKSRSETHSRICKLTSTSEDVDLTGGLAFPSVRFPSRLFDNSEKETNICPEHSQYLSCFVLKLSLLYLQVVLLRHGCLRRTTSNNGTSSLTSLCKGNSATSAIEVNSCQGPKRGMALQVAPA